MPGKIQRFPKGFTGLLGTKGQGEGPDLVLDELRASIDLLDLYAAQIGYRTSKNSGGIGAVGDTIQISVPDRQTYYMHALHGRVSFGGAPRTARFSVQHRNTPTEGGGTGETCLVSHEATSLQAGGQAHCCLVFPRPFIAVGGTMFVLEIDDWTGGFATATAQIEIEFTQISSFPGAPNAVL